MRNTKTKYLDSRRPPLGVGTYNVRVEQTFSEILPEKSTGPLPVSKLVIPEGESQTKTFSFRIAAPRFHLPPNDIRAIYPPSHSSGDFNRILPHIVLKRSSLPWELGLSADSPPWLGLLVVSESDTAALRPADDRSPLGTVTLPLGKIGTDPKCHVLSHPEPEDLQTRASDGTPSPTMVQVIDIKADRASELLPADRKGLACLCHVRQTQVDHGPVGEVAVVVAPRPPQPDEDCTVHLVALENAFGATGPVATGGKPYLRLVCLKTWQFFCSRKPDHSFDNLVDKVAETTALLRLPNTGSELADRVLSEGAVPLQMETHRGDSLMSWYRGPLVPGAAEGSGGIGANIVQCAEDLMRVDRSLGVFDAGYAAAWELGRQLAIADGGFVKAMAAWRHHDHETRLAAAGDGNGIDTGYLPVEKAAPAPAFPRQWFCDIAALRSLPFRYLVADAGLLPPESLRFFRLDPQWLRTAMLGAASIGAFEGDVGDVATNPARNQLPEVKAQASGVILRSELLTSWPGLHIDGINAQDKLCSDVSTLSPAPGVRLVLFDTPIRAVEIALPAQILHFELPAARFPDKEDAEQRAKKLKELLTELNGSGELAQRMELLSSHKCIPLP